VVVIAAAATPAHPGHMGRLTLVLLLVPKVVIGCATPIASAKAGDFVGAKLENSLSCHSRFRF
jgi:hypothetical protein